MKLDGYCGMPGACVAHASEWGVLPLYEGACGLFNLQKSHFSMYLKSSWWGLHDEVVHGGG
jgi:hypothetical protein